MRTRLLAAVGTATLAVVLACSSVAPLGATVPGQRAGALDAAGCEAFNEYFQVNFAIALIAGFAEAFEGLDATDGIHQTGATTTTTSADIDAQLLQSILLLTWSPKMEQATRVLAKQAPKSLRPVFREQHDIYREGVERLRDVGLTKAQIEDIRDADFSQATPDSLAGDLGIDRDELQTAAEEFGESADVLTAEDATQAQSRTFERVAIDCGATPDSTLDCDEVVSEDLQQQILGGPATVSDDGGTCSYTGEEDVGGSDPEIGVDVYRTTAAYDRIVEQSDGAERLDGGSVIDSYTTFTGFKTCGRTLVSKVEGSTIVVAVCPRDDGDVPDDLLTDVRDSVASVVG